MATSCIAVFGATGNVGKALVPLLVKSALEEIRVVTRRGDDLMEHKSIRVIQGDYCVDKMAAITAMKGCDKILVILPQSLTTEEMIKCGKFLGDCASEAGVATVVRISSFGIDSKSSKHVCSQGPLGVAHLALEDYYSALGLQVVSIRPTSFFSNIFFNLEEIRTQSTMSTPLGTSAKVNWVSCKDIAAVAAKVLTAVHWDQYGTVIDVTGPKENTLSGPEVVKILTRKLGMEKPIVYKETDIPPSPEYAGLWLFLRNGGFDCHVDSVEKITSEPATKFDDISFHL
jgi:uncharacterized protein YbjT (DUF2867 family)